MRLEQVENVILKDKEAWKNIFLTERRKKNQAKLLFLKNCQAKVGYFILSVISIANLTLGSKIDMVTVR